MKLYDQQQAALESVKNFLDDDDKQIFILRGYAGTGKTTLINPIASTALASGLRPVLLALTGRAAKILQEKTGMRAATIHKTIYHYTGIKMTPDENDDKTEKYKHVEVHFELNSAADNSTGNLFIIDEASLVSGKNQKGDILHFGSGSLLIDLLKYARLDLGNKILFIGDPAQLPPVGETYSAALDTAYFQKHSLAVAEFNLTEVIRQANGSAILDNAILLRNRLNDTKSGELKFQRKPGEVMDIESCNVANTYVKICPRPTIDKSMIIVYSNAMAAYYNREIRSIYYPGKDTVQCGDVLQVVKNAYGTDMEPAYYNGDFVVVESASDNVEHLPQNKYANQKIDITFRTVTIRDQDGNERQCKIIDSLLNNDVASLTHDEWVALYTSAKIRFDNLKKAQPGDNKLKWEIYMFQDPYLNALQVKYGYAITCHKAQGGEWDSVIVDYTRRCGLNADSLRWSYTATTRAKRCLYGVSMPNTGYLNFKLNVSSSIVTKSKPSKEAFAYKPIPGISLLPRNASPAQQNQCASAIANLEAHGYTLTQVKCSSYLDTYTIALPEGGTVVFDCYYDKSGMYTRFLPKNNNIHNEELLQLLKDQSEAMYDIDYQPATQALKQFHAVIISACDTLGITITNVVDHRANYYVLYCLRTSAPFADLKCNIDKNGFITSIQPSSKSGSDDTLLLQLIAMINNSAKQ